jgi:hypothetical protein
MDMNCAMLAFLAIFFSGIAFSMCIVDCMDECCASHGGRIIPLDADSICESRLDCVPLGTESQQGVGCEKLPSGAGFNKYNLVSCVSRCMDCCARTGSACDTAPLEEAPAPEPVLEDEIRWSQERADELCTPSPILFSLLLFAAFRRP